MNIPKAPAGNFLAFTYLSLHDAYAFILQGIFAAFLSRIVKFDTFQSSVHQDMVRTFSHVNQLHVVQSIHLWL